MSRQNTFPVQNLSLPRLVLLQRQFGGEFDIDAAMGDLDRELGE
jgi:hypothetical protein